MPLTRAADLDPGDIGAALRLAAGAPSTDPHRTHVVRLVPSCGAEPRVEWMAAVKAPAARHLNASMLEEAAVGIFVAHSQHSGGQDQDIVIWNCD